ncbi:hypothetical protein SDC9_09296 [bioreactor metagenome]|uniref:PIN domain-containing protein n=1 Tax=bioreactor metagenome TaxID=1076179 RepID=A0A644T9Q8_9ZZZZ|nr:PIN domain-containing protein [Desulfitobacterium hafniense]MEA5024185.1 PIN domain-containing protein [Desulfitobacterium hafniense]
MTVFDTNAVLRYILQDDEKMADVVEDHLKQGDSFIPTEVIAEVVYVLSGVYQVPRQEITAVISGVLMEDVSVTNAAVIIKGLETFATTTLDFVDCLMVGYQYDGNMVFTFDKKLKKMLEKLSAGQAN